MITPDMYTGHYLAVFLSNKNGPRWQEWNSLSEEQQRARQEIGLPALLAWDEKHKDVIVHLGGPLGPTKTVTDDNRITDTVNEMTAFVVVRAPSHEAAVKMFENHPHMSVFPCHAVEVMPLLGPPPGK
jgi:hypothetical protein